MFIDFQTVLPGIMDIGVNMFVQKIVETMQIVITLMEHAGTVVKQDSLENFVITVRPCILSFILF